MRVAFFVTRDESNQCKKQFYKLLLPLSYFQLIEISKDEEETKLKWD